MDDKTLAKQTLGREALSLCVAKNNAIIFSSHESGILPLYQAYRHGMDFASCAAADKIVGLGAAMLWHELHIECLHAHIISAPAHAFLTAHDIDISYDILTNGIKNRTGDGFCPIETLAKKSTAFDDFILSVQSFLEEKELI